MSLPVAGPFLGALCEPAALLDAEGRVVAVNAAFAALDLEDALAGPRFAPGSQFLAVAGAAHARGLAAGLEEVLAGRREAFTYAYEAGKSTRHFELAAGAYRDDAASGALLVHREVTERARLAAAHREAEERLQSLIGLMPDGYWDWDLVTGKVFMSQRWCESLGYTQAELPPVVDTWIALIHPEDAARVNEALEAHLTRRTDTYQVEYRPRMKDGTYRWQLDRGRVIRWSEDGKPLQMVGIDINIHERKLAELTINEQARRITEMSTPLIPITDDVVVVPLIGVIDSTRAQRLLASVLTGVQQRGAKVAILDITGVTDMDAHVVAVLHQVAKAVQLLGARVVLTGIRPEIATLLVRLEIDWGQIVVRGNLQAGIAYATAAGANAATRGAPIQ